MNKTHSLSLAEKLPAEARLRGRRAMRRAGVSLVLGSVLSAGCVTEDTGSAGMETAACLEGACFGDLECLSDRCVAPEDGGTGSGDLTESGASQATATASETGPPTGSGVTSNASTPTESDGTAGSSAGTSDEDDSDSGDETESDTSEDCTEVSDVATIGSQQADIVFVIDNSGSMDIEAGFVQEQMNAFSTQISEAAVDVHVVLLSAYPGESGAGICISPPLGAGGCPETDDNPPDFLHVDAGIGSTNALQRTLTLFPNYQASLRPSAALHLVIVSDDDSNLAANSFLQQYNALIPNPADLKVHGIVADEDPISACTLGTSCCLTSAAEGSEYKDLVDQTGGVFGNLCDQEFQPIFQEVAEVVIQEATVACEFPIPPPPDNQDFDRDQLNVEFDDGPGTILEVGRVESAAECAGVSQGWYYDDQANPTSIIACPQTCETIQGFDTPSISIKFGCATIPAG